MLLTTVSGKGVVWVRVEKFSIDNWTPSTISAFPTTILLHQSTNTNQFSSPTTTTTSSSSSMAISASNSPLLLSFLFLSISVSVVFAEIRTTYVLPPYARPITRCDEFGFTYPGRLELNVSQISLPNPILTPIPDNLNFSKLGFFLCTRDAWLHVLQQLQDGEISCALDSNLVVPVLTFKQQINNINVIFPMTSADQYTLVFANCLENFDVSMRVRSAMYNLEGGRNGGVRRDYLSAGKTALPRVYFLFALIYFALTCLWIHTLYKKRSTVFKIHFFMLAVVIMKMLNLLFEAEDKSYIKRTGSAHYGWWDDLVNIFIFFKTITQFPLKDERMIYDIGPFAQDIWYMGMPSPVFGFICDVLYHGSILFMIVAPIKYLRETARTDRKAAVKLMKWTLFKQYYLVVLCYIYFTRVVVFALVTIASYKYLWTSVVAAELTTLALYAFTGYKFKPKAQNPYFVIPDEEDPEVAADKHLIKA